MISGSVFAPYQTATHELFDAWPRYEHDEHVGAYPQSSVPVLLLNGTLDSATPIDFAEEVAAHHTHPHQTLVTLPRATHGTLYGSPTTDGKSCGLELLRQFIVAPTGTLDTSCKDRIRPHAFEGTAEMAQRYFGSDDLWENPSVVARKPATRDEALVEELRRAMDTTTPFFAR